MAPPSPIDVTNSLRDGANALLRRFVHGPGIDEPLVQYEGADLAQRRFLHADERGSIIAVSDASGAMVAINRYDEYGKPQASNSGRFQYTGQMWLGELGLYHYKARMYAPHLGRFVQADPIGYDDGPNMYAYVGNDPVNLTDPTGMEAFGEKTEPQDKSGDLEPEIVITRERNSCGGISFGGGCYSTLDIVITGITVAGIAFDIATFPSGEGALIAAAAPGVSKALLKKLAKFRAASKWGRPKGIPRNWVKIRTPKGYVKYVDPKNPHNSVHVKPDGTVVQHHHGRILDSEGLSVGREAPGAHGIKFEDFIFRVCHDRSTQCVVARNCELMPADCE